ncbi:MAG: hypothetical protein IPM69_03520 [Ignavibacteria bacterium]|nr:hypothetical protein [Ignavibacteria bacterium]
MENQQSTKSQIDLTDIFEAQRYQITGSELDAVLKTYGLTQKEFGEAIGKSRVTVCRMINQGEKIKLRYSQILEKAVGSHIYTMIILQHREKKAKRLEQAIKSRGLQMEAERLKKEKKEDARLKKLGMTQLPSK